MFLSNDVGTLRHRQESLDGLGSASLYVKVNQAVHSDSLAGPPTTETYR
jgi:hypothetical protein